jgi:hypothetical protein
MVKLVNFVTNFLNFSIFLPLFYCKAINNRKIFGFMAVKILT